jgi:hypothetical protein
VGVRGKGELGGPLLLLLVTCAACTGAASELLSGDAEPLLRSAESPALAGSSASPSSSLVACGSTKPRGSVCVAVALRTCRGVFDLRRVANAEEAEGMLPAPTFTPRVVTDEGAGELIAAARAPRREQHQRVHASARNPKKGPAHVEDNRCTARL